jgi:hypothetical protein
MVCWLCKERHRCAYRYLPGTGAQCIQSNMRCGRIHIPARAKKSAGSFVKATKDKEVYPVGSNDEPLSGCRAADS